MSNYVLNLHLEYSFFNMSKTKFMIFLSKSAPLFCSPSQWMAPVSSQCVASMLLSFPFLHMGKHMKVTTKVCLFLLQNVFSINPDSNISIDTTLICAAILFSLFHYSSSLCFFLGAMTSGVRTQCEGGQWIQWAIFFFLWDHRATFGVLKIVFGKNDSRIARGIYWTPFVDPSLVMIKGLHNSVKL